MARWRCATSAVTSELFGGVALQNLIEHRDILDQFFVAAFCFSLQTALHKAKVEMPNFLTVVAEPPETKLSYLPSKVHDAIVESVSPAYLQRIFGDHLRSRFECLILRLVFKASMGDCRLVDGDMRLFVRPTDPAPPLMLSSPASGSGFDAVEPKVETVVLRRDDGS
eukprot:4539202-Prymnesium_polylepis.1